MDAAASVTGTTASQFASNWCNCGFHTVQVHLRACTKASASTDTPIT